ncbi:amino acid transporter family protein [Klebsormidium nitens]|uniref:Amino acid transporter family protein n=1 Tax=Klebsormidium nitens TaxID=105231 RepID=A0A1Y1I2D1_KLENI|nr:amino acid transporter family protein [Klebsormidium nitens]|eukprot:GAQ82907.1 amino acid transporter family protein [Klebsormidium nitens]
MDGSNMEAVLASIAQVHAVLKCPICKEDLKRPIASIPCGHDFCEACIILSLEAHGTKCPVCQQPCWRSGIVRNQMLENVVSRLQDAKKLPPTATQTSKGRSFKLVAPSRQGQNPQEKGSKKRGVSATEDAAAISRLEETDGSRGPSSRTSTSTPSSETHEKSGDSREQIGADSGRGDKRKVRAAGLKWRKMRSTGPVGNLEALGRGLGTLERRSEQQLELEKSGGDLARIGPTLDVPGDGDAMTGVDEPEDPLSTQAEAVLESEIAAQEAELRDIDIKLLVMGIDPAVHLSQVTTEQEKEEAAHSTKNLELASQASQRLESRQPEQKSGGAVEESLMAERGDGSDGTSLAQPRTAHDAVDETEQEAVGTEAATRPVSENVFQAWEMGKRSEQHLRESVGVPCQRGGSEAKIVGGEEGAGAGGESEDENENLRGEEEREGYAEVGLGSKKGGSAEKGSGGFEAGGGFTALDAAMDPFAFDPLAGGSQGNGTPGRVTSGGQAVAGRSASKRGTWSKGDKESKTPKKRLKVDSDSKRVGTATRLGGTGRLRGVEAARESARLGSTGRKEDAPVSEPSFLDAPVSEPPPVAYTRRKRGGVTSPVTGKSADSGFGSCNEAGTRGEKRPQVRSEFKTGENTGNARKGNEGGGSGKKRTREVVEGSDEEWDEREGVQGALTALGRAQGGRAGAGGREENGAKEENQVVKECPKVGAARGLEVTAERASAAGESRPEQVGGKGKVGEGDAKLEGVIAETPADGFGDWGLGLEDCDLDEQGLVKRIDGLEPGTNEPVKSAGMRNTGPRSSAARKTPGGSKVQKGIPYDAKADPLVDENRRVEEDRGASAEAHLQKAKVTAQGGFKKNTRKMLKSKALKGGKQTRKPLRDLSQRPLGRPQEHDNDKELQEALARSWVTTPLTATQMGLLLSSLSMLGLGLVNAFACTVMLQAAEEFGTPESYHDLTQKVLGARWALLLDASVVLAEFFGCCQRLILMGDFAVSVKHRLITHRSMPNRPLIVLLLAGVLIWPLIYTKKIKSLDRLSLGAVICTLTGFVILTYTFIDTAAGEGLPVNDIVYANWRPDMLLALPLQQFAFAGQTGILPIYREMRNRNLARGKLMVYISFTLCGLLYVSFGILGYLQYPGTQEANFFNLYEDKSGALYTALYFIVLIGVVAAFPLNVIIGRLHLGYLLLGPKRAEEPKWAALFATVFFLGSVGVAVGIKNLGVVQGIGGGLGDSFINLVVPGFALLKLIDKGREGRVKQTQSFENPAFEGGGGSGEDAPNRSNIDSSKVDSRGRDTDKRSRDAPRVSPQELSTSSETDSQTGSQSKGQQAESLRKVKGKDDREQQAPAGSQEAPPSHQSSLRRSLCKFAAYGLFAIAALQAAVATAGNLASLCLVGWDDASLTFYPS